MKLQDYFTDQIELQKLFQKKLPGSEALPTEDSYKNQVKLKEHILLLINELCEVLNEINYKPHSLSIKEIDKEKITIELVDVFKYFLNLLIIMDIDIKEFEKYYNFKSELIKQRLGLK